ncbi:MAG: PAS domain S-box protein [Nitrospirae bacterium]|nr:MAG: PAS domain S-box protein [Nitrospirota bacterium]
MIRYAPAAFKKKSMAFPFAADLYIMETWELFGVFLSDVRNTEEQLKVSEERFRAIFDSISDAIFIHDPETGAILDVNQRMCEMFGYSKAEALRLSVGDMSQNEGSYTQAHAREWLARAAQGEPQLFEWLCKDKSGRLFWAEVNMRRASVAGTDQLLVLVRDISGRKKAEEALQQSERRYRELFDSMIDGFALHEIICDAEGKPCDYRFLEVNPAFERVTGLRAQDLIGRTVLEVMPKTEPYWIEQYGHVAMTGETLHYKNYSAELGKYYEVTAYRPAPGQFACIAVDITEQRLSDLAKERSEKLLQAIIDTEPECVKLLDAEAKLIMMNRAGLEMLQADSLDQVKGQCVCPLVTSEYRQAFLDLTRRVFEGETGTLVFEVVGIKGRHVWLETHAVPFRNEKDEIVALLGITRDITEHRRLEEQLRQSQKMESIGTLAGGVAHDFNNILTAIIGYGHLTLMSMGPDDPVRLNIENMLEAAERAAHLTKDLLLFSRKQLINKRPIDLNAIVRKLEKFLARVIGEDISFQTNLPDPELRVLADAHQLEQVLMNLATNARDAMPMGGSFTLTTGQVRLNEQFIALHGYGKPEMYALITVSDTGIGMDEETLKRIYEPFYTTKEVGKGTGLGLAVIYGIVRQHEGFIHAYSEPGLGTTFRIFLPLLASMQGDEQAQPEMVSPAQGTETVLLAEDNHVVRNLTETVLKDSGYTVISAVDGEDAVQKYREHKDRIQLLLFDLIMPKKGGKEAYDEIRAIMPDVKILFTSGYSPDIVRAKTTLGNSAAIAYKPISPGDLLRKVRSILDA